MPKKPDFIGFKEGDEFFGCSMLHYYDNHPIFIHSTLMKFNFNIALSPIWTHIFKNETNMLIHKKCKLYNRFFINNPTDESVNKEIFKLNEYIITDNN